VRLASAAIVAASLGWTACSSAGPAVPASIELDQVFSLKVGEWAHAFGDGVRVGFDAVTADSRCPRGEQCVVAGSATVRMWLQQGAGPAQRLELLTASGARQAVVARGLELRLIRLEPYPISGKPIAAADHVATLTLSRSRAVELER
jgi:hypothetical protein